MSSILSSWTQQKPTHTCNPLKAIKQIGTVCFAIFSILISAPLFATGVSSGATSADCDNSTLNTYSGTSNLQAGWQANTIQLHWYNGDTEITSGVPTSCTYDGTLTPPTTIPTRTGYTFKGWRVKQPSTCPFATSVCGLSGSQIDGLGYPNRAGWVSYEGNYNGSENYSSDYGLTVPGTWAATFSNGAVVRGFATCNDVRPDVWDEVEYYWDDELYSEADEVAYGRCDSGAFQPANAFNTGNTGTSCWCKLESYTPSGGVACNLSNSAWVLVTDYAYYASWALDPGSCAEECGWNCAVSAMGPGVGSRRAIFGVSQ